MGNRTPRKRLSSCLTPMALGEKRINFTDTPASMLHSNTSVNVCNVTTPDQVHPVHECHEVAEPAEPAVIPQVVFQ